MSTFSSSPSDLRWPLPLTLVLLSACGGSKGSPQDAGLPAPTQYLIFQDFTGASAGSAVFQQTTDQATMKADLSTYVDNIRAKVQPDSVPAVADRRYGFSFGPLALDLDDQVVSDTIATAFDVAIEKKIPVAFHMDITHFWRAAKNADGTFLSDSRGADDNREWKDWTGTIADKDPWDGEPNILPSMCFECAQVQALVDRVAGTVVAPALKAGIDRLIAAGDPDLFAGFIVGWEAGSLNCLGYHALTAKGYTSATSLADLNKAQQQILHDYLLRWTKLLADGGVPKAKIYTHTTNTTQWQLDNLPLYTGKQQQLGAQGFSDWLLEQLGNGPDSFWDAFNDDANAGYSIYVTSADEGIFEAIWAEAAKHGGSWAESEGTNGNVTPFTGFPGFTWETYLARIFNHGGTLANLFGAFLDGNPSGPTVTESAEAIAAYQKFLSGQTLEEAPPVPATDAGIPTGFPTPDGGGPTPDGG